MSLLKKILSLALAMYFLVAGMGFNIVKYCCSYCESEGLTHFASHSCSSLHHEKKQLCCSNEIEKLNFDLIAVDSYHLTCEIDNTCSITRVQTDVFSFLSKIHHELLLIEAETFFLSSINSVWLANDILHPTNLSPPENFISGRKILTFNSVLLI